MLPDDHAWLLVLTFASAFAGSFAGTWLAWGWRVRHG